MSDSFQYGDIIFLALIAGFILLRLRATLGKNTGIDPRELWKQVKSEPIGERSAQILATRMRKPVPTEDTLPSTIQENSQIATGLKAIRAAQAGFSTTDFIVGAKTAFEWLVGAFSKGEKDKLRQLLSDERYKHFADEVDARAQSGEKQETTLVAILATDITEASLNGGKAQITVQFTSEQIHVTRDKDGTIIGGDASAIERVIDVWTFERDINARDPNWKIVHT